VILLERAEVRDGFQPRNPLHIFAARSRLLASHVQVLKQGQVDTAIRRQRVGEHQPGIEIEQFVFTIVPIALVFQSCDASISDRSAKACAAGNQVGVAFADRQRDRSRIGRILAHLPARKSAQHFASLADVQGKAKQVVVSTRDIRLDQC